MFIDITRKAFSEWRNLVSSHSDPLYRVVRAVMVLITPWRPVYYTADHRPILDDADTHTDGRVVLG